MTLIDTSLAHSLQLQSYDTSDIPVAGISSKHISSLYINLPIFFYGEHNIAKVTVEAHLADDLAAQLLLGMDVMGHEGFRMDLDIKTILIASCMGFTFTVDIHNRPHHQERRTVKAAATTVIPPRSYVKIETVTPTLPADRHYLFIGDRTHASLYSHVVDANMTWVQAVNDTNKTVYVQRASPIGLYMSSLKILSIGGVVVRRRSVHSTRWFRNSKKKKCRQVPPPSKFYSGNARTCYQL